MKINQKLLALITASLVFAACSKPADKPAEGEAAATEAMHEGHSEAEHAQAMATAEATAETTEGEVSAGEGEFATGNAAVVSEDLIVEAGTEGTEGLETATIE